MVRISQRPYLLQPTLLPQTETAWVALMRDHRPDGHVTAVQTLDAGQTWRDLPDLALVNPDAAIAGLALAPGQMVLTHNSSAHSRQLLDLSGSADGLQWSLQAPLARGTEGDEYSYPAVAWADGALWLSYTDHRRNIAWQRLGPVGGQP